MSEEGVKKPVTLSRDELYSQVWQTPMMRLGERYGVSGNGLKKICDRLNVPYPPLGYWAKVQHGKPVKQPKLPHTDADTPQQVTITPTLPRSTREPPRIDPEVAEKLEKAKEKSRGFTVPESIRRPHASIAAWITEREREIADARRDRSRWGTAFMPKPFDELEKRQQRILDTLFKEAEKRRIEVRGAAPHKAWFETGGHKVEFTLREYIRQVRRPLNEQEKADWLYSRNKWRQEKVPTGELIFTLHAHLGTGVETEWRDGDRRLEEQLGDILAVLSLAGPILDEQQRRTEEAQQRQREAEQKRQEEQARRRKEKNRWRRFLELADRWEQTARVTRFIEALEKLQGDTAKEYGGYTTEEWLTWVRANRDVLNPLRNDAGDVWTNLASVTSWEYRESESQRF